jgi:hypothetical protein
MRKEAVHGFERDRTVFALSPWWQSETSDPDPRTDPWPNPSEDGILRAMALQVKMEACLALRRIFSRGPLRRFGVRSEALATSVEQNISTRVAAIPKYSQLFRPFTPFAGKRVVELGCSRG